MEDLSVDFADYKTIFSYEGRIEGVVESCNISDFKGTLDESLKESLSKAKGVLINFKVHKSQSLFLINDLMSIVFDLINSEADVIFSTEENSYDDEDLVGYEIILTGL